METFNKSIDMILKPLDNKILSSFIYVLLILYSSLFVSKIPAVHIKIINNPIVKFILLFIIMMISKKDPTLSLFALLSLILTMESLMKNNFDDELDKMINNEEKNIILKTNTTNNYQDDASYETVVDEIV